MSMFQDIKNGRFYLGDCLEVMKEIPDGVIDLTVTSPPYDDLRTYNGYSFDFENIAKELYRITKEGGVVVWVVADATKNGSETGTSFRQALYFMSIGFNLHDTMLYMKNQIVPLTHNRYEQAFEYMFVFTKGRLATFNPILEKCKMEGEVKTKRTFYKNASQNIPTLGNKNGKVKQFKQKSNAWFYSKSKTVKGHPAQFPLALARDHIKSWSNEGDLVFDPFGGSGTTACAAIETNRKWVTCEISEEYANLAVKRILNHETQPQEKPENEVKIDSDVPVPEGEESGD